MESVADGWTKDSSAGTDHTCTTVSAEPDRSVLRAGSTTRHVTACKCEGAEATWRPVHSSQRMTRPPSVPRPRIPAPPSPRAEPISTTLWMRSANGTVDS